MTDTQNSTTPTNDDPAIVIEDATEEESPEEPEQTSSASGDVVQIMDLERAIKTYHSGIGMKQTELKKFNEMISDTLENDQTYYEQGEKVKEVKAIQQKTKEQLMSVGSIVQALEDIKELRAEMKDLQKMLSENLMKYYQVSNLTSITMDDGETYVIQTSAKLVKQSSKYTP